MTDQKHKEAAIRNIKLLGDHLDQQGDMEESELALLAGSIIMHIGLYIGDGLHRIAKVIEDK